MTLDDTECQNKGFYGFYWKFHAARRISRVNCDRHGEAAYEIFSIERRYRQSKFQWTATKWLEI